MTRLRRLPWIGTLLVASLLCAGNTPDTMPLHYMEFTPPDLKTQEIPHWTVTWVQRPAWAWIESFFGTRAPAAREGACGSIIKCTGAKWGAVGSDGKWVVDPVWERIRMLIPSNDMEDPRRFGFEVDRAGKKGVLDWDGKPRVPVTFDAIEMDGNGFVHAMLPDGYYQVYNPDGRLIQPRIELAIGGGPDRFWVYRDKRWGLFDRSGKQMTPFRYAEVSPSDGPAWAVRVGRRWGMVDLRGRQVSPFSWSAFEYFIFKKLVVANSGGTCNDGFDSCKGGLTGVLDHAGKVVLPAVYECVDLVDHEDGTSELHAMKPVARPAGAEKCSGGRWQVFDGAGRLMTAGDFAFIDNFHERPFVRAVSTGRCTAKGECTGGAWGVVDRTGKVVVPYRYQGLEPPDEKNGTAFVMNGKWGFLDARFREAAPAKYEALNVDEGAVRFRENGKWGVMDPAGKVLVPARYDRILRFGDGVARFSEKGRWGLLSASGKVLIPAANRTLCRQVFGRVPFSQSGVCTVPSSVASWARVPVTGAGWADRVEFLDDDCSCTGARFGLLDLQGQEVLAPKYSILSMERADGVSAVAARAITAANPLPQPPGGAWVLLNEGAACDAKTCIGGKWGLADLGGRMLVEPKYAFLAVDRDFVVRVAEGGTCEGRGFVPECTPQAKWGLMKLTPVVKTLPVVK